MLSRCSASAASESGSRAEDSAAAITACSSAAVVLASSLVGAPVSTTEVLSSSIVGAGVGRRRGRHVRWSIVGHVGISWLTTIPLSGVCAIATIWA